MAVVRYTVANGEIIAEKRGGVRKTYVPDPLGSTIALLDNTQTKTDTFSYWPYGEVQSRTGTTATPFQFVGTLGYYRDATDRMYVRARYLRPNMARWQTVDPLWPNAEAFAYCAPNPVTLHDPTGLTPQDGEAAGSIGGLIGGKFRSGRRGKSCDEILKCLFGDLSLGPMASILNPCKCGKNAPLFKADPYVTLCVFRQECGSRDGSTIDPDNCVADKGGGIGQITPGAVKDLTRWCCNEGVNDPWDGRSVKGDNWCVGARIARNYLTCVGLARYGPPYSKGKQQQITDCASCLRKGYPCSSCFKYIK